MNENNKTMVEVSDEGIILVDYLTAVNYLTAVSDFISKEYKANIQIKVGK